MAKKQKKDEKPIELDVKLSKSEAFIEKHYKKILVVLGIIIVVVAGIFIYRNHRASVEEKAQSAIAQSQVLFMQDDFENALKGDGKNSMGLLKVIDQFSGTKTANLAKYYAGLCYYKTGKTDEAIKMLEDYDDAGDMLVSPSAKAALGNCYAAKGDKQKAVDLLLEAAKDADSRSENNENTSIAPIFMKQAAVIYEDMNQNDKALELYQNIKKRVNSPLSEEMDAFIERLSK